MTSSGPGGAAAGVTVPADWISRLALNQQTTKRWSVPEAVAGCERSGLSAIGLWREPVAEFGLAATARSIAAAGLRVSSLCRGGFLTVPPTEFDAALAENRRAIDEAAALNAACLVLVVGGLPAGSVDLAAARAQVARGVDELVSYAEQRGVRLALEPLHPMYCADRSVLNTLTQALQLAEAYPIERVGVVVDTFHLWWDPAVLTTIAAAGPRIASFQICDFMTPLPADVLLGRAMMGDGHIDFAPFFAAVTAAGYCGDIEVEIFNADVWAQDPNAVIDTMIERYRAITDGLSFRPLTDVVLNPV